mmetsp:Transcript_30476/g.64204  ORF Transcript_30476/g.64204 Transcript_30476/m.64204 type:complete len:471 (-) Transcript_30476:669-2081(-)
MIIHRSIVQQPRLALQRRRHDALFSSSSSSSSSSTGKWPKVFPSENKLNNLRVFLQRDRHLPYPPSAPLQKLPKTPSGAQVREPTNDQLYAIAIHQAIPFIGFGIMDNSILLLAGEAIDTTLGVTLGISTMCAAAIGNIISDVAGVGFGTIIEETVQIWATRIEKMSGGRLKLPPLPDFNMEQRALRSVRWSSQMGCAVGLTIGCVIGMFPLLFFDDEGVKEKKHHHYCEEEMKRKVETDGVEPRPVTGKKLGAQTETEQHLSDSTGSSSNLDTLLRDALNEFRHSSRAEVVTIFILQKNDSSQTTTGTHQVMSNYCSFNPDCNFGKISADELWSYARSSELLTKNMKDPRYHDIMTATLENHANKNIKESSETFLDSSKLPDMLCVPVFGIDGNVIAVIQALNKERTTEKSALPNNQSRFSSTDAWNLQAMAMHLSLVFICFFHREGSKDFADGRSAKDALRIAQGYTV